jgi:hypothetical protein
MRVPARPMRPYVEELSHPSLPEKDEASPEESLPLSLHARRSARMASYGIDFVPDWRHDCDTVSQDACEAHHEEWRVMAHHGF